ncbi:aldehyde dehydrogenase [Trichoderma asperellum]|uniref:aldehyde dehydrogenase (NAD(+)) n=1 Tax=Trichoderma asperellum TaxID=101201 RepID=A0A6V8R7M2_TRIAP|nr:aldehyde dehydrogenase [Trichoderma asperellum]
MSSVTFDLTRFPIPNKLFIGGKWVDGVTNNTQSLTSAVNDEVVCKDLQWADTKDVDIAVESAAEGFQAWQALSKYTTYSPYGVCAAIVPFNGPLVCYALKAASALAAGNSLIVKASELNPFSTLFIVSLAIEAGIPPGVINCITGDGATGSALAAHMKIRKISFTGSLPVARKVQVAAAQSNLKSVTLELGGKSPVIVYPDANLDKATEFCCHFLMLNGQGCMLGTRVYLHESIFDEMMPKIEATMQAYENNLGSDPLDQTTWSSPMFHRRQRESVLKFIEDGKKEAKLVRGGDIVEGKGCYIRPAIFTDPSPNARVLKEEIFGPVVVVCKFKHDDEILSLANDTDNKIEAGMIGINGLPWAPNTTFGGWKQIQQSKQVATTQNSKTICGFFINDPYSVFRWDRWLIADKQNDWIIGNTR